MKAIHGLGIGSHRTMIGPEAAQEILRGNRNNRPIRAVHVESLARDMREGRWVYNGQPIVIHTNGRLLDGQHRLAAIVSSGRCVDTSVCVLTGDETDLFASLGGQRVRSVCDVLKLAGEQNTAATGAGARLYYQYERGEVGRSWCSPSHGELLDTINANPLLRDGARLTSDPMARRYLGSVVTATYALFHSISRPDAELFFADLRSCSGLSSDDPVFVLDRAMVNERLKGKNRVKISARWCMALVIKAWNARVLCEGVKLLRWSEAEDFPAAIGGHGCSDGIYASKADR